MTTRKSAKLATAAAVAAGALTIATGLAVAGGLPDQASDTASEHATVEETTTTTSSTTTTVAEKDEVKTADVENETEAVDVEKADVEDQENTEHPDNHGADVSAVAHDDSTTGREHGKAVSTVARDNHGQATADEHTSAEHGRSGEDRPADD